MRRFWGCLGLALLLASALLLGASQLLPRLDDARWANAKETTGQIIGFAEIGPAKRPLVCFAAYSGDPYVFESDASGSALRQGQIVTVRYFLEPELRASLKTDFAPAQLWLGISGCMLAAAGFASLLLQMRKTSLRRQLIQFGMRLEATVASVDANRRVIVGGRRPYVITCTLRNPQGIGDWTVKSGWVWKLPPALRVGGTVPVLVDLYRPSQYCVLVEEAAASQTAPEAIP